MIKNFLYSIFLHSIIISFIYLGFNFKNPILNQTSEISVSLISIQGNKKAGNLKNSSDIKNNKEAKSKKSKKIKRDKIKKIKEVYKFKKQKKSQSKPSSAIKKVEKKEVKESQKVKKIEKETEKQIVNKDQEDLVTNKSEDKKEVTKKNKDSDLDNKKDEINDDENEEVKKEESSNNAQAINNIDDSIDLSAREKFNIKSQLKRCYHRSINENDKKSGISISVLIDIDEDGYIDSELEYLTNSGDYKDKNNPSYKIAVDNVKRALELCSPLRNLPADKYNSWKNVLLEFEEENSQ